MGGQALFHALRQRGLTLPVVMLSGHPMENELVSLQAQGLAGWLLKPPSIEQLAQLLAQALKQDPDDE
jgi:CheY-like chemotaxis protein